MCVFVCVGARFVWTSFCTEHGVEVGQKIATDLLCYASCLPTESVEHARAGGVFQPNALNQKAWDGLVLLRGRRGKFQSMLKSWIGACFDQVYRWTCSYMQTQRYARVVLAHEALELLCHFGGGRC